MHPFIEIGSLNIPVYSTLFIVAYIIAVIIGRKIGEKRNIAKDDMLYLSIYGAIGLFIGAKVMFFISKLPIIITKFDIYIELWKADPMEAVNYTFGGLVFYGGLIGFVAGAYIYCRIYKLKFMPFMDVITPLIPLVHGVGRIGCFFAGCCYGKEYHGFGSVKFPYNEIIPELDDVPRVPVQLIEAAANFVMFGVLMALVKNVKLKSGQLLGIYIVYYSIVRVIMETMRGDIIRGNIGGISTSQIISIILFPIGVLLVSGKLSDILKRKQIKKSHKAEMDK